MFFRPPHGTVQERDAPKSSKACTHPKQPNIYKTSASPGEATRSQASSFSPVQVKKVIVYLGRDKTMQLLEELVSELQLTDPVSSGVTHMDNPPYYRITSSCKIPSVTSGEPHQLLQGEARLRPRALIHWGSCPQIPLPTEQWTCVAIDLKLGKSSVSEEM